MGGESAGLTTNRVQVVHTMQGSGAGTHDWEWGSVDVGEDICQGWDGVIVGWDVWGWGGHMGGGWDTWEEAGTHGRNAWWNH